MKEELTEKDMARILSNPFYCINISPGLIGEHEVIINEKKWIEANIILIKEIGEEKFLENLLENLKGNYVS